MCFFSVAWFETEFKLIAIFTTGEKLIHRENQQASEKWHNQTQCQGVSSGEKAERNQSSDWYL